MAERKARSPRGTTDGTRVTRAAPKRPRSRSTIGVNPLDLVSAERANMAPAGSQPSVPEPARPMQAAEPAIASQRVFTAWVEATEKTLKVMLDAQTAALRAGISVLEASTTARRDLEREWTAAAREAQSATLSAFRASIEATSHLSRPWGPSSSESASRER